MTGNSDPAGVWHRMMLLTPALGAALWGGFMLLRRPVLAEDTTLVFAPGPLTSLPFALVLGLALAANLVLAATHRQRWRAVLRPTRGRVIGALALAMLTPIAAVNWLPWVVGGFLLMLLGSPTAQGVLPLLGATALCTVAAYPIGALLVSGIRNRWVRVTAFGLVFWGAYAGVILWGGVLSFQL